MLCPLCGMQQTHLTGVFGHTSGSDGRMDATLEFTCENGCEFEVTFHQHKGDTSIETEGKTSLELATGEAS